MDVVATDSWKQDLDPPWGNRSALLRLYTGNYRFSSLSSDQATALERRYRPFAINNPPQMSAVECEIRRLAEPLDLDPGLLTWRGQYALILDRSAAGLTIAGANFRAHIAWGALVRSSLWIYEEAELAYPNVIENFLRVLSAYHATTAGGLLLHSAGILVHGEAHLFPGHSGAGKTTLARKARAAGHAILSDDICLLLPDGDLGYRVFPVPFAGELGTSLDAIDSEGYRLGGIHFLIQGSPPGYGPLGLATAVARLSASCPFVNTDPDRIPELLAVASDVATSQAVGELTVGCDTPFESVRNLMEEAAHV